MAKLLTVAPNLESRPDIRSAVDAVNGESARLRANRGTLFPSLDFNVSQGYSEYEDGSNQQTTTLLTVNLDIFDRLTFYSQYKVQYAAYAAADLRLRQLKLDAESSLIASREQFSIALASAIERDQSYDISQKLYNTGELRFKQGRANANDLEVDHRRLIDSALLDFNGWSGAHQQFTKLCHTLGRSVETCERAL
jgi:outer membrane protein TolC